MFRQIHFIVIILFVPLILAFDNQWSHHLFLDNHGKYLLEWDANETEQIITFLVTVETKGWIGLGLSPNGGMKSSDIVIGWVSDDGKPYFHDRYAFGESIPIIDESQDWNLLYSTQNQTHTILMFSRAYITCDQINDIEIVNETMRLIYAFGETDPKSIDSIEIHKHQNRGTKSAILLSNQINIDIENEEDLQFTDFNANYVPNITPGNEELSHHFLVFTCNHPNAEKLDEYLGEGVDCTEAGNMPIDLTYCLRPYFIWAVGGQPFIAQPEAGFPIGYDEETTYFLLQSHYNNPELITGRIDSSGIRVFHTTNLRPNDAFTYGVGSVIDYGLIIPPKQSDFKIAGHCDTECIRDFIPSTGINLFAALPHAHLLGKKIKTRHFRGNTELPWILNENNYDFNYQQFRPLKTHVNVISGDLITTECTFDSSLRNTATLGGEPSTSEMCLTFFSYYPRMKNNSQLCFSGLTPASVMSISGVEQIIGYGPNLDPTITLPKTIQNMSLTRYLLEKTDWDFDLIENTKYSIQNAPQKQTCYWIKSPTDIELDHLVGYPKTYEPYSPQLKSCIKNYFKQANTRNNSFTLVWRFNAFLTFVMFTTLIYVIN